jgi:putative ABC transport system permease protein
LKDVHLYSRSPNNVTPTGSVTYLYILASIAIFTLLIACINFMNLSTARSSKRAAEVGIRKVLGANRSGLIGQFLGESVLMSCIAFVFSMALTGICLPVFAALSGKSIHLSLAENGWMIAGFFGLALITGLLAGIYPALYLSSFKPLRILKGRLANSLAVISLRKSLVVFQFVISGILIISSVVIAKQMRFMRTQDLGFTKDQQLIIPFRSKTAREIYPSLKAELGKLSSVASAGGCLYYPGIINPSDGSFVRKGQMAEDGKITKINVVDENFIQTLGIQPVAGRLFSSAFPNDSANGLILNEEAVKQMGFSSPQEAIGRTIYSVRDKEQARPIDVVGVVRNFHFQDLHVAITPFGFGLASSDKGYNYMLVHLRPGGLSATIQQLNEIWHRLNPNEPFEYNFLDEEFQKNYEAQDRLAAIVKYFTIIAILISCLGLFGLATFSVEQRTKEIGIRKVLGASVSGIVLLIAREFIRLVLIAVVIASPVAAWMMHQWLRDFAYRTSIGWTVFAVSGVIACLIAFVTVSSQAIKAAVRNPVKSLRTE